MDETEYLVSSKANAERLLSAIRSGERGEDEVMTVEELKKSLGLDEKRSGRKRSKRKPRTC